MKIVLDTNVLVTGLLSPSGPPGEIVRMVASGALELCYDARILSEYQNVLMRPKFSFEQTRIDTLLLQIRTCGCVVAVKPLAKELPDPKDEPFLEAAFTGEVRYLVTGNLKHYPIKKQASLPAGQVGISIVSPVEFLKLYRNEFS